MQARLRLVPGKASGSNGISNEILMIRIHSGWFRNIFHRNLVVRAYLIKILRSYFNDRELIYGEENATL